MAKEKNAIEVTAEAVKPRFIEHYRKKLYQIWLNNLDTKM